MKHLFHNSQKDNFMLGRTKREKSHSYKLILGTTALLVFFPQVYVMIKSRVDQLGAKS